MLVIMQYPQLLDYISEHSSPQPAYLDLIVHRTGLYTINPRMLSGHVQGRFLSFLSQLIRPMRILELGTFAGFSALCLAEGLQPGGKVVTIEKNDELEDFIRENLALSPLGEQVELHIGSTRDVLPTLPAEELFDLVFIDADKREYVHDYEILFPLVRSGGIILADNTLWDGHIIDPAYDADKQTVALRAFNDHIRCDSRVNCLILPVRDGLTIITKH